MSLVFMLVLFILACRYYRVLNGMDDVIRSFSFSDSRFVIPWITVSDGTGHYLHIVEFTFIFSGNDIVKVKTATQCEKSSQSSCLA